MTGSSHCAVRLHQERRQIPNGRGPDAPIQHDNALVNSADLVVIFGAQAISFKPTRTPIEVWDSDGSYDADGGIAGTDVEKHRRHRSA